MKLDYDVNIKSLDYFTGFELLVSSINWCVENNLRFTVAEVKVKSHHLLNKIKSHLAPPRMQLCTPKGCEHPWLGTPDLKNKMFKQIIDCFWKRFIILIQLFLIHKLAFY